MDRIRREKTRRIILEHSKRYPQMQTVDYFKLLFHSAFGCEHAVSSIEKAEEYIIREYEAMEHKGGALTEELDGDYCRVYLGCLDGEITPLMLAQSFCASAKTEPDGREMLEEKLAVLRELVLDESIAVSLNDLDASIQEWRSSGFSAVRHSDVYREAYKPAYRVLSLENARKLFEDK